MHKHQPTNLAFVLPPKEDFPTLLGLFTALSLAINHVYTTETLGKELGKGQKTLCKRLLMKHHYNKGLLCWLEGGMAPPSPPGIILDKQSGPK